MKRREKKGSSHAINIVQSKDAKRVGDEVYQ
jgi:hypothetical protein